MIIYRSRKLVDSEYYDESRNILKEGAPEEIKKLYSQYLKGLELRRLYNDDVEKEIEKYRKNAGIN